MTLVRLVPVEEAPEGCRLPCSMRQRNMVGESSATGGR